MPTSEGRKTAFVTGASRGIGARSEAHTSELQSLRHIVSPLLPCLPHPLPLPYALPISRAAEPALTTVERPSAPTPVMTLRAAMTPTLFASGARRRTLPGHADQRRPQDRIRDRREPRHRR